MTRFHRQWLPIMSPAFHPQFQHRPQFFVRFIPAHMGGIRFCQTGLIRSQRTGWIILSKVLSITSVHFADEVLSDVEAFREEIDVEEEVEGPGGPEECSWTGGVWMALTFARFFGGGHWS